MFKRKKYHLPKFEPPQVAWLHPRPRLFAHLDALADKRVLWISAPAGSGKTSLIASYLSDRSKSIIWYQIDAGDSDVASFFHHMELCIKNSYPKKRGMLPEFTQEYLDDLPAFSTNYFHKLFKKIETGNVLVLDNFQDAGENILLHDAMKCVLKEIPKEAQLVILSRVDPPDALASFQTSMQFSLLSMQDIRFAREESDGAADLRSEVKLSETQYSQLYELTQGWAAGLILTLAHLKVDPDFLSHQIFDDRSTLFNYVAQEIVAEFDEPTRQVLYKTSFLKRISISVAKNLTSEPRTKQILQHLSSNQLLTIQHDHLDNSFEYHPLFREFLNQLAQQTFSHDVLLRLQNKAGELLLNQGDIISAAEIFIVIKNWQALAELIDNHAASLIQKGLFQTIGRWLQAIPDEVMNSDVWLGYWHAESVLQNNPVQARELLKSVHEQFIKQHDSKGVYLSFSNIIESHLQMWDTFAPLNNWINHFDDLQEQFPTIPGLELKIRVNVAMFGAMSFVCPDHKDIKTRLKKVQMAFRYIPIKQLKGLLGSILGSYYSVTGESKKITQLNKKLQPLVNSDDVTYLVKIMVLNTMGIEHIFSGNLNEQEIIWNKGLDLAKRTGLTFFNRIFMTHKINMYIARGDADRAEKILSDIKDMGIRQNDCFNGYYRFLLGRVKLEKNELVKASEELNLSINITRHTHFLCAEGISKSFLALCYMQQGDFDKALLKLVDAKTTLSPFGDCSCYNFSFDTFFAYIYLAKGEPDKTDQYLKQAFVAAQKDDLYSTAFWYTRLYQTLAVRALVQNIEPEYTRKFICKNKLTPPENKRFLEIWPWPVKIYSMGGFAIYINEKSIDTDARPFDLLKVLLAFGGREVPEDKISDALWPNADGDQAQANFKTALHRLRKALGDQNILQFKNHQLSLNDKYCWVDMWGLTRLFQQAQMITGKLSGEQGTELVTQLLHIYKGHFLVNEISDWVVQQREGLRLQFTRHISNLSQKMEQANPELVITSYQRLLEIDPLIEIAYQGLIRIYQQQGRKVEAQTIYQQCKESLSTAGVKPSQTTNSLVC